MKTGSEYEIVKKEPLEALYQLMNKSGKSVLVIDNLEAITSTNELVDDLGNILTLIDDEAYSKYKIKLVIVGVPSIVRDYFNKMKNQQTVANRIHEIPEVSTMSKIQVDDLISKGFLEKLKITIEDELLLLWKSHIYNVTLGIPQRLHEYCEVLAYLCQENGWVAEQGMLAQADSTWLNENLSSSYSVVESMMNDRRTTAGRRNQVLYSLGQITGDSFSYSEVEEKLRELFADSTYDRKLAVGQILAELSTKDTPIIKRTLKGAAYQFCDPKYLMCLRIMLQISEETNTVSKRDFSKLRD